MNFPNQEVITKANNLRGPDLMRPTITIKREIVNDSIKEYNVINQGGLNAASNLYSGYNQFPNQSNILNNQQSVNNPLINNSFQLQNNPMFKPAIPTTQINNGGYDLSGLKMNPIIVPGSPPVNAVPYNHLNNIPVKYVGSIKDLDLGKPTINLDDIMKASENLSLLSEKQIKDSK